MLRFNLGFDPDMLSLAEMRFRRFGFQDFPRALQFSINGVAMDAVGHFKAGLPNHLDNPKPWTSRGIKYAVDRRKLSTVRNIEDVKAEAYIDENVSPYLKYLFGFQQNIRRPGDVGLARREILIPMWENLSYTRGIKADRYGNLPISSFRGIHREVSGTSTTAKGKQWRAYRGEITMRGHRWTAYIARPPRAKLPNLRPAVPGRQHKELVVRDRDVPHVLFLAVQRARYQPLLQGFWDKAAAMAAATLPARLEHELDRRVMTAAMRAQGMTNYRPDRFRRTDLGPGVGPNPNRGPAVT